jgi:tRNA A37 threonylcarbamoyladenosine dehydratase
MATEKTEKATKITEATPDYKKLYVAETNKTKVLENKVAELEKLCKSFAEQANIAKDSLQRATLEYNTRTDYMLDCVKHAYVSIQMASTVSNGGNK